MFTCSRKRIFALTNLDTLEQTILNLTTVLAELKAQTSALASALKKNEEMLDGIRSEVQEQMKTTAVLNSQYVNTSETMSRAFSAIKDLDIKFTKELAEVSTKLDTVRQSLPVMKLASNGVLRAATLVVALVIATVLAVLGIKGFKT